jgi:hypothetical protein
VLKEQDRSSVIKHIAKLLRRLSKLFQIPNFDDESCVILAEWVYDNYKFEQLSSIEEVLSNPPLTKNERGERENNWRLTPDTIQRWMDTKMEQLAIAREKAHAKMKEPRNNEPLANVDYDAFRERLAAGLALQDDKKGEQWTKEEEYLKYKAERATKIALQNPKEDELD